MCKRPVPLAPPTASNAVCGNTSLRRRASIIARLSPDTKNNLKVEEKHVKDTNSLEDKTDPCSRARQPPPEGGGARYLNQRIRSFAFLCRRSELSDLVYQIFSHDFYAYFSHSLIPNVVVVLKKQDFHWRSSLFDSRYNHRGTERPFVGGASVPSLKIGIN